MSRNEVPVRWFAPIMTVIGVVYVLLASWILVRGVGIMGDFEVPDAVVSSPAFADFFTFFYQLMAVVGVLLVVFGRVTRARADQLLVARVLCVVNALLTWRDLSTSDSSLGNHLYRGSATLIPVGIDFVLTLTFGFLSLGRGVAEPPVVRRPRGS
jgi:hypothetical protein